MTWAFGLALKPSSLKFLLLALADNADDQGRAFPSLECLVQKTSQDRKTVIAGLDRLEELKLATDTGSRVGRTKQVKVYRLERFLDSGNSTKNGFVEGPKGPVSGTGSENGTVPVLPSKGTVFPRKESRKRYPDPSWNHKKEPSAKSARTRLVPEAFEVTGEMQEWATANCPGVDVVRETANFRDHEFKDPHTDWVRAWRKWMRRSPEFNRSDVNGSHREDTGWRPSANDPKYAAPPGAKK